MMTLHDAEDGWNGNNERYGGRKAEEEKSEKEEMVPRAVAP